MKWLKLTGKRVGGNHFVNFDNVRHFQKYKDCTSISFGDVEDLDLLVEETPEQIMAMLGLGEKDERGKAQTPLKPRDNDIPLPTANWMFENYQQLNEQGKKMFREYLSFLLDNECTQKMEGKRG